jgi:lipopolysaccharide biosynthesis glycosyltransferase
MSIGTGESCKPCRALLPHLFPRRTYLWTDLHAAVSRRLGDGAALIDNNAFKICASVRLLIPFGVAEDADRVLYIDNDSIVSCDLTELYDSARHWLPAQIIGAAPEGPHDFQPTHYTGMSPAEKRPTAAVFPGGLNSGVLLMQVGKLRELTTLRAYWSAVTSSVREGLYRAERLGNWTGNVYFDQDILVRGV